MLAIKSPQTYYSRPGLCAGVGGLIAPYADRVAIITSPRAWQAVASQVAASLEASGIGYDVSYLQGECTRAAVAEHQARLAGQPAPFVIGIGGGRVLDCAKAVADGLEGGNVATMPTIAATCAAWSPISIMYNERGGHEGTLALKRMPALVLVDSEIIARSDVRYLKAGIVDALAKWYEFQPYRAKNGDSLALNFKIHAAAFARDIFNTWGEQALAANARQQVTPALQKVIDANIAGAGLANSMRDDSPSPGVAHAIHNRMTHLPELHGWLHGEKVGFGLLVQSLLARGNDGPDAELLTQLRRYDAPLHLIPLGDRLTEAARYIAASFKFPSASAALLPFSLAPAAIERAVITAADQTF
ncbi:iron-containing alcohol dehydrogenase family protein [Sodalis sp. RH22]|uniref:iron-containing alcohol dehydrogenase family protein n=1 Tax=unclassified Sodalis (in: enterobacteria) TaxID=2636512 RepID=UPI0039B3BD5F